MTNEKVDAVIVGAGASGSVYASVLAKAGKKVVLLEAGPDWELSDLISSEIWGRRIKPAGAPIILEGKNPMTYAPRAAGASAARRCTITPTFLDCCRRIFESGASTIARRIGRSLTTTLRRFTTKVARETGVSGDAKAEENGGRPEKPIRCRQ